MHHVSSFFLLLVAQLVLTYIVTLMMYKRHNRTLYTVAAEFAVPNLYGENYNMTRQLSLLHSYATEARNLAKRFSLCVVRQRLQLLATNILQKKALFDRNPYLIFVIFGTLLQHLGL